MSAAAAVGVVGYEDVTNMQTLLAELLQRRADGESEGAQKTGYAVALGNELPSRIGETGGEVQDLVDNRALRGALQGGEHLIADGDQRVLYYFDRKGIELRLFRNHHPQTSVSMIRHPYSSTRSLWSGKTTVEAAGSSTIAGPSSTAPAPSRSRSYIEVPRRPSSSKSTSRLPFNTASESPFSEILRSSGLLTVPKAVRRKLTNSTGESCRKVYSCSCNS